MNDLSGTFRELWVKRKINIAEYEYCESQLVKKHHSKVTSTFIFAIIFLVLAVISTYFEQYLGTVIFLAIAVNFNSKSNNHMLVAEILQSHSLIAKLVNRNYMDDEEYLKDLERSEDLSLIHI